MDRLSISSAVPAHIAERQSDHREKLPPAEYLDSAREDVLERLYRGKRVGNFILTDAFDVACQEQDSYKEVLAVLETLACLSRDENREVAIYDLQKRAEAMVDAFVNRHPELVEDRAAEMLAEKGL